MVIAKAIYLCLALNIFHEAGVDPIEGQLAVAMVTINRAKEAHQDICTTVFKSHQFSWTIGATDAQGHIKPKYFPTGTNWEASKAIAKFVLTQQPEDFTHGATHYYADYIKKPSWARHMTYQGKWGTHYFYKKGNTDNDSQIPTSHIVREMRQQGQSGGIR